MKVDLSMLRSLQGRYAEYGEALDQLDATSSSSGISGALPNSRTEPAVTESGSKVDTALADMGRRLTHLSHLAKDAADGYDTTDLANVDKLEKAGLLEK